MSLADAQPLSTLTESSSAHIHVIQTDNATRIRLLGMGIGKGSRIDVLRNRNGDIVLGNGNNRISLGRTITDHIMVHVQE
ncbi:ferrous iron transport protein A [Thiothrix subterranea]|uniref:FeoA family protein n=1 Tax=Thiothrix subterranea TaxID=2735563 RepID=UPI00192C1BD5|nr:ferrous iron transport protein A [Thiothrix subterranea]QQZ29453.1 ferrous iron transport protein A [Thiothrix subterranea]